MITKIREIEMIKKEKMNQNQKNLMIQNLKTKKIISQNTKINIKHEMS